MSLTQYIAIRSVLDYQIEHHPENELLKKTVQLTLCSGDLSPEDKEKAKAAANYMVNLSDTGKDKSFIYSSLVAILGVGLCGIIMGMDSIPKSSSWMNDVYKVNVKLKK